MKIKITEGVVCGGKPRNVGEVVDASETDARVLMRMGRAVKYNPPGRKKKDAG